MRRVLAVLRVVPVNVCRIWCAQAYRIRGSWLSRLLCHVVAMRLVERESMLSSFALGAQSSFSPSVSCLSRDELSMLADDRTTSEDPHTRRHKHRMFVQSCTASVLPEPDPPFSPRMLHPPECGLHFWPLIRQIKNSRDL